MILRLILGLAVLIAAALLIRHLVAKPRDTDEQQSFAKMVTCERCGIYLPKPEAHEKAGKFYCCRDHAETDS